jgi:Na+-translocating ferredoxin:NAD+ oxidoreductase RnfD subunit
MKLNTVPHTSSSNGYSNLQAAVAVAANVAFPTQTTTQQNPYANQSVFMEVTSLSEIYDYNTANQVVQAGLTNNALTQNAFLSSAQMDNMQKAYRLGTKVFVIRDSARCFTIPVATLTQSETSMVAQMFANCVNR